MLKHCVNALMIIKSIDLFLHMYNSHLSLFVPLPCPSGSLSVSEVVGLLGQETLRLLKKECGGLQTLLRNNHQVFRGSFSARSSTFS